MWQKNTITASKNKDRLSVFAERFGVPEQAIEFIPRIFSEEEINFVTQVSQEVFSAETYGSEFLRVAYEKGIVSLADETGKNYCLNNFYGMLDVYVVSRKDEYDAFSQEEKKRLDDWYFQKYYDSLTFESEKTPTADRILPLEEVLDFIERQERPVYLNYCDCRSLTGACGLPTRTCITYKNGINSFADRGLSQKINKEQAKQVVREADKAGLMHTVNDNGICNCCGDCCYLFRSQELAGTKGVWPATKHIIEIDKERCVACGKCLKRCHFHVFRKEGTISCDTSKCVGCGICVNTCPKQALHLKER